MVSPLKRKSHILTGLVIPVVLLISGCATGMAQESSARIPSTGKQRLAPYIRVNIIPDAVSLRLDVGGYYEIQDTANKVLSRGKNLKTTVTGYKEGILLGKMNFTKDRVFIHAHKQDAIIIDGRRFRGDIQIIKKENLHLTVINYIELEDYIKGVMYHEASHYWPQEALKAQAICVRSFALYQMQENKSKDFDVTSDIYSQVYGGRTSERYRTNQAVEDTKDQILTYKNKIFPAYYHATCAGHTEDASLLWNINIAPLKGVSCGFCKDSPHFRWDRVLSRKEAEEKLANAGYKVKDIKEIIILGRDKSSRITKLKISGREREITISAKDFRNIIGPNIIRSTNFKVNLVDSDLVFAGSGWGHGAGLCQWGSYFMAKQGSTYQEILKYYYPGSLISSTDKL